MATLNRFLENDRDCLPWGLHSRIPGEERGGPGPLRTVPGRRRYGTDKPAHIFNSPRNHYRMPRDGAAGRAAGLDVLHPLNPAAPGAGQVRQWSAAGTPFLLHTVTGPVTGPASARSSVVVSMGSVPAAARKFRLPRAVSHTIKSGRARPAAAIRR